VDVDSLSKQQRKQIWGDDPVTTPALAVVMPDGFVLLSNTDILPEVEGLLLREIIKQDE